MAVAQGRWSRLATEVPGRRADQPSRDVRNSLEKRFDIEGINHPDVKEIDIHRDGEGWVAIADYEDVRAAVRQCLASLVQFHKQVELQ